MNKKHGVYACDGILFTHEKQGNNVMSAISGIEISGASSLKKDINLKNYLCEKIPS